LVGVIDDAAEQRLNAALRELETKTTAQLVVLTLDSLGGEPIDSFSIDLAHNRWQLGRKGKDNGLLFTLAVRDRVYRIEVGYGLESVLPDSAVGSLGRELLVPALRRGDYAGGITALTFALAGEIAGAAGVQLQRAPAQRDRSRASRGRGAPPGPLAKAIGLLFLLVLVYLFIRHPRLLILLMMMSQGGGHGRGWSGGGGFGGGGGGGFGGGGASGRW
jgi:uncharacterized protein